ncbi:hypothetical protein Q3G72_035405 [Acer saccharum]|nr:hypothetical protein Q3G72_035405 [Acer saccharum]
MQQDNGGGGGDNNKPQNQQDRRLKPIMQGGGDQNNQNQQQQPQPQKCPRCESVNTKFCYYNNYSLSQPRFFCKTCRRYWTQGGTLRNVPVGGGCRKGKRTKSSSSSSSSGETSRSSQPPPTPSLPQVHQNLTNPLQNMILSSNPVLRSKESGNLGSYYPSGGFLSSLSAIQPLNPTAQSFNLPLNQPLNAVGGGGGGGGHGHLGGGSSSNLDLLQGFNVPSFVSQPPQHPQQIHQTQFFQMGNRPTMYHLHQPSQEMSLMDHSNRLGGGNSSQHQHQQQQQDWHQSFFNSTNTNPNVVSDTALWSISTSTSTSGNTNSNSNTNTGPASASASLNPNQWPDLSGYGAPPP